MNTPDVAPVVFAGSPDIVYAYVPVPPDPTAVTLPVEPPLHITLVWELVAVTVFTVSVADATVLEHPWLFVI